MNCTSCIADIEYEKKALHEAVEIKYFYAGSSTLIVGKKTISVQAGDMVIINPYEFHATIGNGEKKGQYHILLVPLECFYGEMEGAVLADLLLERRVCFQNLVKANAAMKKCFRRIADEYTTKAPFHHTFIHSLVLELIGLLLRNGLCDQNTSDSISDALLRSYQSIEPALRYIRDNYFENISVERLAKLCGLSKCYFCRLFKLVIGKTAIEYLREYRIKVAHSLLENSDRSISQIAVECGFADYNYFGRCYKQYYGMSPGKHREASREK